MVNGLCFVQVNLYRSVPFALVRLMEQEVLKDLQFLEEKLTSATDV
jgi:hypothetical protein